MHLESARLDTAGTASQEPALQDVKAALREQVFARRDALDPDWRLQASSRIVLHALPFVLAARLAPVAAYWPMRSEVDPRPLMAWLHASGVRICLPVVGEETSRMVFRAWAPGDTLARSSLGVMEPAATAAEVQPRLVLTPLAAFDRAGRRIGYGRGHYDRTLAALSGDGGPLSRIGLAFAAQEVDAVPTEPHDQPLDAVITEDGVQLAQ